MLQIGDHFFLNMDSEQVRCNLVLQILYSLVYCSSFYRRSGSWKLLYIVANFFSVSDSVLIFFSDKCPTQNLAAHQSSRVKQSLRLDSLLETSHLSVPSPHTPLFPSADSVIRDSRKKLERAQLIVCANVNEFHHPPPPSVEVACVKSQVLGRNSFSRQMVVYWIPRF
jgi:hypothetical protein